MEVLTACLHLDGADAVAMLERFVEARDDNLDKGEALVCHVAGVGPEARIVAVERHLP
jgi:8-oxo-dGTP diphosphatase